MVTAVDPHVGNGSGDECGGVLELFRRAEGVATSRDEETWNAKRREVRGAQTLRPSGRVEGIAHERQPGGGESGPHHRGADPAAHRATTEEDRCRADLKAGRERVRMLPDRVLEDALRVGPPPPREAVGEV